jgi:coproporphyrinogen III oxidase-like Fe-S oxidoreductase
LTDKETETVASTLADSFNLTRVTESTIESSPETISPSKLALFRKLGFNRISIGVQSLDDDRLRRLGRMHTAAEACEAVEWAATEGFEEINIDLMCGFPDESLEEIRETIVCGLRLPITHLSIYSFRPTSGTVLRRSLNLNDSNLYLRRQLTSFTLARKLAASTGFNEYAVGYFGRPSLSIVLPFQLRLDSMGCGSGAISLVKQQYRGHSKGRLTEYLADPLEWDFSSPASSAPVSLSLLRSGLSVFDGIPRNEWAARTGVALEDTLADPLLAPVVKYLRSAGHMIEDADGIRLPRERAASALLGLTFGATIATPL